jgi:hypothetical protein
VRKHKGKLLGAVTLALVAAWTFAAWLRPSRITLENCERVKHAITRAEVEAVLGPPSDDRTGPTWRVGGGLGWSVPHHGPGKEEAAILIWKSDEATFCVGVGADGSMLFKDFVQVKQVSLGLLTKLRWRAERLWRKWFPSDDPDDFFN